uniref:ATP synthase F0 subunit 8 n=1 Tax=Pheidole flavigaster TaxID=3045141 RepID=UPI00257C1CA5|nr:ATP synthase F0 subunit 8 [Pheidole flavigaster]WGV34160.1 ATP synthase F0 subunit 8 [Pheidole flavigaster]
MPQMMPMLWSIMLIFTMTMLLMVIIFIYFLNLPLTPLSRKNPYKFTYWNWLW